MSRTTSGRRPAADPNSIEAKYLKSTVGPALVRGLAEIVERRPNDPIEYLATYLYKQVENQRARQQKEDEVKQLEIEKENAELEKQHRAQLKKEIRALREREEHERKQREAEEARRREAEELAKRHKEMTAAMAPTLPAVREEDDEVFTVEFGETELHRQAKQPNANLTTLLRGNYHLLASRDAHGKTARDVAVDGGFQGNVDQIDDFCVEFARQGNTKAINDLVLSGYTEIVDQAKTVADLSEEMTNFLNEEIPQTLDKLKQFKRAIRDGDTTLIENLLNERKQLAFYRDKEGSTALHDAIEQKQFQVAVHLHQRFSSLSQVKDARERICVDLLNAIDDDSVTEDQRESYDQLKEVLAPNVDEQ